jgi:hypothetical protein
MGYYPHNIHFLWFAASAAGRGQVAIDAARKVASKIPDEVLAQMPMLALAVSGLFILLMSGLILYETQNIIGGGETNYVMATVTLFVAVFNLFTSFLHLLGFLGDDA